jgi:GNAT superfamily N-acetyltransferase
MYREALDWVREQGGSRMQSETRDDDHVSLEFAKRRGFEIERHTFESCLDLATFDEAPFAAELDSMRHAGIKVASLTEVGNTLENRRRLWEVNYKTALDTPGSQGWMSFEEFDQRICGATWFQPAGQLVAIDGDRFIGLCAVRLPSDGNEAYNLMTGVLREYRGRGIAIALKLHGIRYAREHGAERISTHNDSKNAPMLAINRRLGYIARPGKYILRNDAI